MLAALRTLFDYSTSNYYSYCSPNFSRVLGGATAPGAFVLFSRGMPLRTHSSIDARRPSERHSSAQVLTASAHAATDRAFGKPS